MVGHQKYFSGFLHDISQLKQAQNRLTEINLNLIRSNSDLKEFASAASHDLKSPLRTIHNLTKFIREDNENTLSATSSEDLATIEQRASRMTSLLNGILDSSQAGKQANQQKSIDLNKIVEQTLLELKVRKTFKITCKDLPIIHTDAVPLSMVLRYIIGNAVAHHPSTQGEVIISSKKINDSCYEFYVSDNGEGVPSYMAN